MTDENHKPACVACGALTLNLEIALEALQGMIRLVDEVGGFLYPEHQEIRTRAVVALEANGFFSRVRTKTWRDR